MYDGVIACESRLFSLHGSPDAYPPKTFGLHRSTANLTLHKRCIIGGISAELTLHKLETEYYVKWR